MIAKIAERLRWMRWLSGLNRKQFYCHAERAQILGYHTRKGQIHVREYWRQEIDRGQR